MILESRHWSFLGSPRFLCRRMLRRGRLSWWSWHRSRSDWTVTCFARNIKRRPLRLFDVFCVVGCGWAVALADSLVFFFDSREVCFVVWVCSGDCLGDCPAFLLKNWWTAGEDGSLGRLSADDSLGNHWYFLAEGESSPARSAFLNNCDNNKCYIIVMFTWLRLLSKLPATIICTSFHT